MIAFFIRKRIANWFLIAGSILFYAWGEPLYVFLMLFSIGMNWAIGRKAEKKVWLTVGIIINIAMLVFFKYTDFLISNVNGVTGLHLPLMHIALPIGISFFTFQAMSYLIDIYRGEAKSGTLEEVALYISFFPQLIAGPIVKYKEISEQIHEREITRDDIAEGFRRFIYGLGKKVLIANVLGQYADSVFAAQGPGLPAAWLGVLCYTFQIYYDFSGYSDMAIGIGRMFGFRYPENFRYPYLSHSITEFWRRWHISLGSWFREYVYIPLGGNRRKMIRNLCIIFLLTGIWHGADLSFVLWGVYHGVLSLIERAGLGKTLDRHHIIGAVYCFMAVMIGWVLFRADNITASIQYFGQMFAGAMTMPAISWKIFFILALAIIGDGIIQKAPYKLREKWTGSVCEAIYCVMILILSIASIASNTYNPFIYFQF